MINYKYRAQDETGRILTGVLAANDEIDLHEKLKADKKYLVSAKAQYVKKRSKRIKANVISEFARNIGKLLSAGVTLVKALKITAEDESTKPEEREIYANILKLVKSGMPFSDALLEQGDTFPPLFINMIKSAEAGGNLDQICMQMSNYYDKEYRLNSKIKSSMTYPKILSVLIVIVVAIIMGYVIPQFSKLFEKMERLPFATRVMLAISDFVKTKWYVILFGIVVAVILFKIIFSIPQIKYLKDKAKLKLPVIGKLLSIIYTARFARTLSSLYSAGISIINCLQIARNTIGNLYIERQFDQVIAEIRTGGNLSDAIDKVDGFTKKLSSSVMVGEETGSLDTLLVSIADQMEYDSELAINKLVSYLEPVMIVVMAVIVGFIIISVIQPIYGSYSQISNNM